jgi:hypothetical protein
VGCWSTAYAQILYYHRLTPHGHVRYDCANGHKIDVDLGQFAFQWERFPNAVTPSTPKLHAEEAARYCFATAVAVRKDFGTDAYKRMLSSVQDLEAHYDVEAEIYVHLGEHLPVSRADLEAKAKAENISNVVDRAQILTLLSRELAARRPVYFHFGNLRGFGHSTVIDGMRTDGPRHWVHINYGAAECERNRWYELFAPIAHPEDEALRAFVTIRPASGKQKP